MFWLVLNYVVKHEHEKLQKTLHADFVNVNIALNLHSYEENC